MKPYIQDENAVIKSSTKRISSLQVLGVMQHIVGLQAYDSQERWVLHGSSQENFSLQWPAFLANVKSTDGCGSCAAMDGTNILTEPLSDDGFEQRTHLAITFLPGKQH